MRREPEVLKLRADPANFLNPPGNSRKMRALPELPHIVKQKLDNPTMSLKIEQKIECLSSCVRVGMAQAEMAKDRNLLMVIGNTGAGKSTLVNYLAGCQMEMIERGEAGFTTDLRTKIARVAVTSPMKEVMGIGHENKSATFLPAVHDDESLGLTYCDCPGFLDNRGAEINIANACNIKQTIAQARSVRVIVLINYNSLKADRGRGVKELAKVGAHAANSLLPFYRVVLARGFEVTSSPPSQPPHARASRFFATCLAATWARLAGTRPRCSLA